MDIGREGTMGAGSERRGGSVSDNGDLEGRDLQVGPSDA